MDLDAARSFLGTGWAFPPRFGHAGTVGMASDAEDIREALRIILSTTPGERVMHPTFGCGLCALVFEQADASLRTRVKDLVMRAVAQWEQRVQVELVAVHVDALDTALMKIELGYRIRATNTAGNLVFPFYLGMGQAGGAP